MANPVLREDFKDSILAAGMNGRKQYRMISNANGTVSFEDVTVYDQEGSEFGAKEVNDIAHAFNNSAPDVLDAMEEINANTMEGKIAGALALKEGIAQTLQSFSSARQALESALVGHGVSGITGANFAILTTAVRKLKVISSVTPTQIYPDSGNIAGGWTGTPSVKSYGVASAIASTKKAIRLDEIDALNIDTYTYHHGETGETRNPKISVTLRSTSGESQQMFAKNGAYGTKNYGINVSSFKGSYYIDIKVELTYAANSNEAEATVSRMTML